MLYSIQARNVNSAFRQGYNLLQSVGIEQGSRAGKVLVAPTPVVTEYMQPEERVLFHSVRDANPVFHLMEALWMLGGRNDATWLDQFVADFSERFAEDDGIQHGAYGFRWRQHFDIDGGGDAPIDQLDEIVELLAHNPDDRRVVLTMWDPIADLNVTKRDVPCNTHAYFRVNKIPADPGYMGYSKVLDITVCCRSNDIWWGAYGANAVHFSVLQEYLASRLGILIGSYYQISNNFHIYQNVLPKTPLQAEEDPYYTGAIQWMPIVTYPEAFDADLKHFLNQEHLAGYNNPFFPEVAVPLLAAYKLWRGGQRERAINIVLSMRPSDWRLATEQWMTRRMVKLQKKKELEHGTGE